MATRKRDRVKRTFLLLVALCILAFLLELNRFLPGTWPGGGGGGFKAAELVQTPERVQDPQDDVQDPAAVAPPQEPPANWPPPAGIVVEVRGPDGSLQTGWRLGTGGGKEGKPGTDGRLRTGDARAREKGFRIGSRAGKLRHEHGVNAHVAAWSVHLPAATLPSQRDGGRAGLKIVDAITGKPIEGASVEWRVRDRPQSSTSDATGEAVVTPEYGGRAVRARVSADGYEEQRAWASPRDARQRRVALAKTITKPLAFVDADGKRAAIEKATVSIFDPDGRLVLARPATDKASAPETHLETTWVEVHTREKFVFRTRFDRLGAKTRIPASKELSVLVRDTNGEPIAGVSLWATEARTDEGGTGPFDSNLTHGTRSDRREPVHLRVAADQAFKLRIEAAGKAPIVRAFTSMDGNAPLELVAQAGINIPVRISTDAGDPLPEARVVARASVDGVRIVRRAMAGSDGRAELGPFGRGHVEIFVTAKGRAWSATLVEAKPAMATTKIALERGYPVHLIVEDPYGVPLSGVDVELSPAGGGRPLVSPPPPVKRTTNAEGRLTIEHVPNGLYAVRLTRDGHHTEVLRGVQPGAVTYFATLVPK